MTLDLEGPIWRFAADFYSRSGVAPACLTLQDSANLDVVHLILLLYAEIVLHQPLATSEIPELRAEMEIWREATVVPLRRVRQRLKDRDPGFPGQEKDVLRTEVKHAELMAEQIQLAIGEAWLLRRPAVAGASLKNALTALLESYAGTAVLENDRCRRALLLIVRATKHIRA